MAVLLSVGQCYWSERSVTLLFRRQSAQGNAGGHKPRRSEQRFLWGLGDPIHQGVSRKVTAIATPFEEWPEEVKKGFMYDPDGAESLLDEAGYPRGADGIRFKTVMTHIAPRDLNS